MRIGNRKKRKPSPFAARIKMEIVQNKWDPSNGSDFFSSALNGHGLMFNGRPFPMKLFLNMIWIQKSKLICTIRILVENIFIFMAEGIIERPNVSRHAFSFFPSSDEAVRKSLPKKDVWKFVENGQMRWQEGAFEPWISSNSQLLTKWKNMKSPKLRKGAQNRALQIQGGKQFLFRAA